MNEEQKTVEQITNEIKAAAWNACIVPHLESISTWFKRPEWAEAVGAYLVNQRETLLRLLVKGNTLPTDDKFVIGRISMLMDILDMPGAIERNIKLKDEAKKRPQPGTYTDV
jgi:hypothetical protein